LAIINLNANKMKITNLPGSIPLNTSFSASKTFATPSTLPTSSATYHQQQKIPHSITQMSVLLLHKMKNQLA